MKILELFAGSKSFGNVAKEKGHQVFSTDINDFEGIDLVKNILDVKPSDIPFISDVIWASPPCTYFSVASIGKHWNKDNTPKTEQAVLGMAIADHTSEIIRYFKRANPELIYFVENPRGKLRKLDIFPPVDLHTVWYCQYGESRAKPTDIWSNCLEWIPRPQCKNGNKDCHHEAAPRGSQTGTQGIKGNYLRSIVPKELCNETLKAAEEYYESNH